MSTDSNTNVSHTEAVQTLIDQIRTMQQNIPNFTFPKPGSGNRNMIKAASTPAVFIELAAAAIRNNPVLSRVGGADPEQLRDLISFAEAYAALVQTVEQFAGFLRHTITAARNEAGVEALAAYALAQRLSRHPKTAYLKPIAASLRAALPRTGTKKPATQTPEPPAPQTPTTPTV